ncbi:plasmid replication initiator RepA [Pseudoalteromonas peptidolytica]|uniref:Replication protein n=1 Tax=Pseudoalteromonas peptidolytica F12-50-A1 TaxID=1315280 RepID=A0A8I0MZQ8_9GAMM|nr:plasmid replication initiator RepA [Pseudoalteromonas peptidolytica]MBE0348297.1 hypothetical protein [Pseudoalteromonas peptidolytica F12-50-A1]NLR16580.1 hypothetical protein [Pseudoalteromonas peptidolytica]GEK08950.1 putative replication-associated protein repA1 [Pseudoalteromonas peptidolytica]
MKKITKSNRKGAVDYCNRVKNADPRFDVPESHYQKGRLAFINDAVKKSHEVNVLLSDVAMWARANCDRYKAFYKPRADAIRALVSCFAEHYHVVTGQCQVSLRNAADLCGLSTISQREKEKAKSDPAYTPRPNITRATRAFQDLVEMGWVNAPKNWQIWDKHGGQWIDKLFELTPLFFKALGITPERLERQREARLKYLAKSNWLGLSADELASKSLNELKQAVRHLYARAVFERRAKKQEAAKLRRQLKGKTPGEQRHVAAQRVIKRLGTQVKSMSNELFSAETNQELALMRRIISRPDLS